VAAILSTDALSQRRRIGLLANPESEVRNPCSAWRNRTSDSRGVTTTGNIAP